MRALPLGVDIGSSRLRVVFAAESTSGCRVCAVATREMPAGAMDGRVPRDVDYIAALLEDAVNELRTRERRCVGSIGMPAASLRSIQLPQMSWLERERAARFEAARHIEYPLTEATVRLSPLRGERRHWALGIVRTDTLGAYQTVFKKSGLRLHSVQDEGCALRRAFHGFDAILDIGRETTTLYLTKALEAFQLPIGGDQITKAIAADLRIDERSAEKRKKILGTSGAGDAARNAMLAGIAALSKAANAVHSIQNVALTGNGSRLPGFAADLHSATRAQCAIPVSIQLQGSEAYPKDVIASCAPDWTLAAALAGSGR